MNPPFTHGKTIPVRREILLLRFVFILKSVDFDVCFCAVITTEDLNGMVVATEEPEHALRRCGVQALFCSRAWAGHLQSASSQFKIRT